MGVFRGSQEYDAALLPAVQAYRTDVADLLSQP